MNSGIGVYKLTQCLAIIVICSLGSPMVLAKNPPAEFANISRVKLVLVGPEEELRLQYDYSEFDHAGLIVQAITDDIRDKRRQKRILELKRYIEGIDFSLLVEKAIVGELKNLSALNVVESKYLNLLAEEEFDYKNELLGIGDDFDGLMVVELYEGIGPLLDFYEVRGKLTLYGLIRGKSESEKSRKVDKYRIDLVTQSRAYTPPFRRPWNEAKADIDAVKAQYMIDKKKNPERKFFLQKERDKKIQEIKDARQYYAADRDKMVMKIWSQDNGDFFRREYQSQIARMGKLVSNVYAELREDAKKGKKYKPKTKKITAWYHHEREMVESKQKGYYLDNEVEPEFDQVRFPGSFLEVDVVYALEKGEEPILVYKRK